MNQYTSSSVTVRNMLQLTTHQSWLPNVFNFSKISTALTRLTKCLKLKQISWKILPNWYSHTSLLRCNRLCISNFFCARYVVFFYVRLLLHDYFPYSEWYAEHVACEKRSQIMPQNHSARILQWNWPACIIMKGLRWQRPSHFFTFMLNGNRINNALRMKQGMILNFTHDD